MSPEALQYYLRWIWSEVAWIHWLVSLAVAGFTFGWSPARRLALGAMASASRFARHRTFAVVFISASVLGARLLLLPWMPVPQPQIQDEFAYLLSGDTFASGRLTNPTHPMWVHFESMHIIQKPTYNSKYPPAQGLALAGGEVLGHPWIGVLFSTALMCGAFQWMFQGWVPAGWALLGALFAVGQLGIFSYWMNTYWGGSVAAIGGALLLGALPRLRRTGQSRYAVVFGIALAILANSRPFEGLMLSIPAFAALAAWAVGQRRLRPAAFAHRVLQPLVLVLAVAGAASAYYCYRVTGSPLRMPYSEWEAQYGVAPALRFLPLRPEPHFRHAQLRESARFEAATFNGNRAITLRSLWKRVRRLNSFFLGSMSVALLLTPLLLLDRRMRWLLVCLLGAIAGFALEIWTSPHYFAPASPILFLMLVQCLRHVRAAMRHARTAALVAVTTISLLCAVQFFQVLGQHLRHPGTWPTYPEGLRIFPRDEYEKILERQPGGQLVIVRYGSGHNVHEEWVYNRADIDASKVVWARDMSPSENEELVRYFHDRRVWLMQPDNNPPTLMPYLEGRISE